MQPNYTPECLTRYFEAVAKKRYARFWSQVVKTETCWLWQGHKDEFGYGRLKFGDSTPRAHRLSYEMEYGPIPPDVLVRHTCDTPACIRPDHLILGSYADNAADRDSRGRGGTHGERNRHAKLTAAQVLEIRARWTGAWGQASALMREYGIKAPALYGIINGTTWKHLR